MHNKIRPPRLIVLFSGKRKSGKDYLSEHLLNSIGREKATIIRISEPIKTHWAKIKGLNLKQLMGDGPYKERYRREMIDWSDEVRRTTPEFFCREAYTRNALPTGKPVIIVSDIRRRSDIAYFRSLAAAEAPHPVRIVTVRVHVDDMVRVRRGWTFQQGVDDVPSECDLDAIDDWDVLLCNDGVANGGPTADAQLDGLRRLADELLLDA